MNKLNEPKSDALEDNFFEYLGKFDEFTDNEIKEACIYAHNIIGGEEGDEPIEYCRELVSNDKGIEKIGKIRGFIYSSYKWKTLQPKT